MAGIDSPSAGIFGGAEVFGRNQDIDIASFPEDVVGTVDVNGEYAGFPTSVDPVELFVQSTSQADNGTTATGALTARVAVLRTAASKAYEWVTITLNGTTPVSIGECYRAIFIECLSFGSGGQNAGTITVQDGSANVYATIPIIVGEGLGQSADCVYTVPAGLPIDVRRIRAACATDTSANTACVVSLRVRPFGAGGFVAEKIYTINSQAVADLEFPIPLKLEPLSDVKITVDYVSDNNTAVDVTLDLGP